MHIRSTFRPDGPSGIVGAKVGVAAFLKYRKKIKYASKMEEASSWLRKDNAAGNYGDTILSQIVELSEGHCHKAF